MKLFILEIFIVLFAGRSFGLDALPYDKIVGGQPIPSTLLQRLQFISEMPQWVTCKEDLEKFVKKLTSEDVAKIQKDKPSRTELIELSNILKKKIPVKTSAPKIDFEFSMVSIMIPHGPKKPNCLISVTPGLGMDEIKSNVDPGLKDFVQANRSIPATLIGSSASAIENPQVHLDPSKADRILKIFGASPSEISHAIEAFDKSEPSTVPNQGPQKSKSGVS